MHHGPWRSSTGDLSAFQGARHCPGSLATLPVSRYHRWCTQMPAAVFSIPLMSRMHKPDPKLAHDEQDKRSVIPLDAGDFSISG